MSNIPLDVPTRWNSTFKLLAGAMKFKNVFSRMSEESVPFVAYFNENDRDGNKRVGPPIEDDWEMAKSFMHFLQKFYATTLKLSATKTCTSNLIFQQMIALQVEIDKKIKDTSDPTMQSVAKSMKLKFDKYWGSYEVVNKLVFVCHVLDPRYKLQLIRTGYRNVGVSSTRIIQIVDGVKACLLALYNEYKGVASVGSQSGIDSGEEPTDEHLDGDDAQAQMVREMMQERKEQQLEEITNDVDKYLSDPFESISDNDFKLLDWWRGNITRYPVLSKIAKDVFSIPSSSENAFSLGRRIVDPFRASLTPKMVEALVCSSDWLRGEEFNYYKEPTDEHLEFYKELEEIETSKLPFQFSCHHVVLFKFLFKINVFGSNL